MASVHEKLYKFCPTCKTKLKRKLIDRRRLLFCSNCSFTFWNNPKPVASVILHNNGKILLLQRANKPLKNFWCLPGGYIDYEETPEEHHNYNLFAIEKLPAKIAYKHRNAIEDWLRRKGKSEKV